MNDNGKNPIRMHLSTRTINLILLVCVAAMTAVCAMSICSPVNFDRQRAQRETAVKERLVKIRTAQERYRKATGSYAGSFAQLIDRGFLADSLQYVPYAEGQRFRLSATMQTTRSGRTIPLMECGAEYKTYLRGLNSGLTRRLTEDAEAEGRYPGLKIGDLTTPNDNDGNWE